MRKATGLPAAASAEASSNLHDLAAQFVAWHRPSACL